MSERQAKLGDGDISPEQHAPSVAQDPGPDPVKPSSGLMCFLRVFTYNDTLGWLLNAVAVVCMVGAGATLPLMEILFGRFVNVFNDFTAGRTSPQGYRDQIGHFTLYFIYLFVAKLLLTYIWTMLISMAAIRTTRRLRVDFLRQALRQEISFFDSSSTESSSSSSVVAGRITTNGELIHDGISEKLGVIVQAASCFVAALSVALAVQWKLTLIVVSVVPLNIVISMICIAFDAVYEQRMLDVYAGASSLAHEAFSSVRTVHAFWAFPRLRRRFDEILERARGIGRRKSLVYAVLFPTESLCVFAGYAIAFWRGIAMYADGEIASPGTVVTVVFAVMLAAQALVPVVPHIIAVAKAAAAAKDLFAVIDRRSAIDSLSEAGDVVAGFQGDIRLRGVCFAYPSRPRLAVLSGLDLDLPAGKTTALVGASGSGKSTVFGLLERWYDAASGSITLDGRPIQSLNLQWLRTNIRLVQQEPILFSGSIFQNVADGLAGTDRAGLSELETRGLVREACEAAYAHDFIQELPDGYDTRIGERGASLSGGQKQRIVIARSIVSNPKVLLLDEATSALDPVAEEVVQRALNNVSRGRTMVVIAHRLSTVRDADNVAVLSGGQVIEQGTHQELMALGGAYSSLVKAQDLGEASHEAEASDHDVRDKEAAQVHLVPTCSDTAPATRELPDEDGHGLLYGLYLILKEQPSLWPHVSLLALACIISGGTYPALAILFSKTMETFDTVNVQRADFFAFLFFVVALANAVSYGVAGWLCNVIGQTIAKYYRSDIFNSTIRQDMTFFDKTENSSGSLVSRLSSEPTSLQELLSINLPTMLINTVSVVSSCVLAICYGWQLGLALSLGALPVLVGAGYLRVRLEYRLSSESASRYAQSSGMASEAAAAMRTVSSLALERAVVKRYDEALDGIARRAMAVLGRKMLLYALSQSASFLVYALGFWYGGRLVSTGEYSTAQFYVVFIATIYSGESAAVFFQYTTSISKAHTAINYVFKLRRGLKDCEDEDADQGLQDDDHHRLHETDQEGKGGAGGAGAGGTSLVLDQITFAYPLQPSIKVLRDIALNIKPGQTIALVGASGCGKSTVVSLLERFYEIPHGEIRADGTDITTLDRRRYRTSIALVQQEPVLFQGSIRDNIAVGIVTDDAEDGGGGTLHDDDIISACIQANIWTFISSLPDGLSTPCGSQGLSLSGGQRQRIAIARALVRNPRLLLLDEATSALDSASEAAVKEALDSAAAAAGRTTVAIAHRLSTVRDADAIAVLAGGRVVEMGTHRELVARRGVYHCMVLGQTLNGSPDG